VTGIPQRATLNNADFIAALREMLSNPAQSRRLKLKADIFAEGTGMEGDDLLQEAVRRTLEEDRRNCPTDVPVSVYLGNAMRSIANGERAKYVRETPSGAGPDENDVASNFADDTPSPENAALNRIDLEQTVNRLQEMFADDPQALAVVIGAMEEWAPEEIKEMETMDDKQYATARRRVRRAIAREFGGKDRK
jgi:hypothetical protein